MAPECLCEVLDLGCIESLKKADIYSFALIVWEVFNRTLSNDINAYSTGEHHHPPYYEHIQGNPPPALIRYIVCECGIRPQLPYFDVDHDVRFLEHTACYKNILVIMFVISFFNL